MGRIWMEAIASRRRISAALGTTLLTQAIASAAVLAPTVVAPLIASAWGMSVALIGVYISVVYVSAMVASVLSGPAIGAIGGIRMSQLCLLVCAAGLCLIASASLALAALGAVLVGFAYGPLTPASSDVLIRAAPPRRMSVIYSLKQTGVPLGGVLAGLLLPAVALWAGWNWALVAIAAACVACAIVMTPFRTALDGKLTGQAVRPQMRVIFDPVTLILRNRNLRTLAIGSLVLSGTQVSFSVYLVTFLTQSLHWQIVAAGVALSVSQAFGAIGRVLWGWVADTDVGAKRTLIVLTTAMTASSLSVLAIDASTPGWTVVALMAAFGATAVGWNGVYLAAIARLAPSGQTAFVTGGALAFTYLGVVIGPPMFGAIAEASGSFSVAFSLLAVPLLLCAFLLLGLDDPRRAAAEAPRA